MNMGITPHEALQRTIEHREIFHDEMIDLMRQIMRGEVSPAMTAAILTGLRVKKETVGEIAGAAAVMRELAEHVTVPAHPHMLDIVGTGGDGAHSFNISTTSMFVAAAAGARVAKHGNRGVSSSSGSADVLEALGAKIDLGPEQVARCIGETGIGFMFAPRFHPRTLFNILGPLTNPANAPNILMGVFHPDLVGIQVRVLQRLGIERALVVHGKDGLDEISLGGATLVGELRDGKVREYEVEPEQFGIPMASSRNLRVKKETVGEITGAARVMRELSAKVDAPPHAHFVDIVGTGAASSRITRAAPVISPTVSFFTRRPVMIAAVISGLTSPFMIWRISAIISSWKISRCSIVRCRASCGVMVIARAWPFMPPPSAAFRGNCAAGRGRAGSGSTRGGTARPRPPASCGAGP